MAQAEKYEMRGTEQSTLPPPTEKKIYKTVERTDTKKNYFISSTKTTKLKLPRVRLSAKIFFIISCSACILPFLCCREEKKNHFISIRLAGVFCLSQLYPSHSGTRVGFTSIPTPHKFSKEGRKKYKIKSLHGNNAITVTCYRRCFQCRLHLCVLCCKINIPPLDMDTTRMFRVFFFHHLVPPSRLISGFFIMIRNAEWITTNRRWSGLREKRENRDASWHIFFCTFCWTGKKQEIQNIFRCPFESFFSLNASHR